MSGLTGMANPALLKAVFAYERAHIEMKRANGASDYDTDRLYRAGSRLFSARQRMFDVAKQLNEAAGRTALAEDGRS